MRIGTIRADPKHRRIPDDRVHLVALEQPDRQDDADRRLGHRIDRVAELDA